MKKFALAIREEGDEIKLTLEERNSIVEVYYLAADRLDLMERLGEEYPDAGTPPSLSEMEDFFGDCEIDIAVLEIPDSAPRAVRMGE